MERAERNAHCRSHPDCRGAADGQVLDCRDDILVVGKPQMALFMGKGLLVDHYDRVIFPEDRPDGTAHLISFPS